MTPLDEGLSCQVCQVVRFAQTLKQKCTVEPHQAGTAAVAEGLDYVTQKTLPNRVRHPWVRRAMRYIWLDLALRDNIWIHVTHML